MNLAELRDRALKNSMARTQASKALQENEYDHFLPLSNIVVPAGNGITSASVTITQDGDFRIKEILGSFEKSAGVAPTISVRISDQGRGNTIIQGFAPLHLLLTPGEISNPRYYPQKLKYTFSRSSTILFEFTNSDAVNSATVNIL